MAQISFDYNKVVSKAKELDNIASSMQTSTCKEIDEVIKNIEASWSGDSAKLFITYLNNLSDQLKKQAKYLNQSSDYLRDSAEKMKKAEQTAKSAAQSI